MRQRLCLYAETFRQSKLISQSINQSIPIADSEPIVQIHPKPDALKKLIYIHVTFIHIQKSSMVLQHVSRGFIRVAYEWMF